MSRNFFSSPNPYHPSSTLPRLLNSGPGSSSYRERDRPIENKTYDADIFGYRTNEGEKEYQKDIKQVAKKNIKDFKNDWTYGGRRTRRAKKSRKSRKARKSRRR
jgi:hypothetical protein